MGSWGGVVETLAVTTGSLQRSTTTLVSLRPTPRSNPDGPLLSVGVLRAVLDSRERQGVRSGLALLGVTGGREDVWSGAPGRATVPGSLSIGSRRGGPTGGRVCHGDKVDLVPRGAVFKGMRVDGLLFTRFGWVGRGDRTHGCREKTSVVGNELRYKSEKDLCRDRSHGRTGQGWDLGRSEEVEGNLGAWGRRVGTDRGWKWRSGMCRGNLRG